MICCHSDFSERQSVNAGRKNTKRLKLFANEKQLKSLIQTIIKYNQTLGMAFSLRMYHAHNEKWKILVGWLVGWFYGISTFVGYLTLNPFL